VILE